MSFSTFSKFIVTIVILANVVAGLASCGGNEGENQTTAGQTTDVTTTAAQTSSDVTVSDDDDLAKDSGWTKDYR